MSYYKSILTFLKNEGYLALPGIGVWSISRVPTKILSDKEVFPSSVLLQFENHFQGDIYSKQVSQLSKDWSCSDLEVRQVLLKLGSNILDSSSKHESYLLPGLGYILYADNQVQFDSTGDVERSYNYYNQSVSINKAFQLKKKAIEPIKVLPEVLVEEVVGVNKEVVESKPRSLGLYKYAAAAILFIIIGVSGWNLLTNADRYLLPVRYDLDSSGYDVESFNRSPESDGTENNIDQVLDSAENIEEEPIATVEAEVIDHIMANTVDELEENNCIYILGSFGSSSNVNRMMKKIESLGLSVHREASGKNIRIGAVIPCSDQLSLSQLKQIEPNAWLLDL